MHTKTVLPYELYNFFFNATATQSLRVPNQMYKKQLRHLFAHYNKDYSCHGVHVSKIQMVQMRIQI